MDNIADLDGLLFKGDKMRWLLKYRQTNKTDLREAQGALKDRFEYLKSNHSEKFEVPLESYWDGFYSRPYLCRSFRTPITSPKEISRARSTTMR